MSLLEHLEELRSRLTRAILAALVGFGISFAFAERILEILLHPLKTVLPPKSELITTALTEGFFISMKAAFVAGIFLVSPYIFYQIWSFIAPGLYENERKLAIPVAFFTALCFVSGACFGYFVVFPYGFTFLANYAADVVTLMPKLSEYYSFCMGLLFAFGIIFEMPVFIFFLARLGVVDHIWLRKKRRWAIVVFFIVAAILTPTPDAVNQILMAAPMVVLYEVSIWVAYFFGKKKSADENLPAVPEDGAGEGGTPDDAGPGGASGTAPPSDAALDEAHASENPGGDAGSTPAVDAPADPHEAEREAHEQAALGHDLEKGSAPQDAPVQDAALEAAPAQQAAGASVPEATPALEPAAEAQDKAQAAAPAACGEAAVFTETPASSETGSGQPAPAVEGAPVGATGGVDDKADQGVHKGDPKAAGDVKN
ncbi:MAG: twin-arginine translocase subunit TatC [Desulfovibrio sp.]|nr:twin-arginine translocase subunit TatC [Desulfovibrio sp.]MBI4959472.1 twin-arginine translocase subunit TatC [Desulfovibrio sp.]